MTNSFVNISGYKFVSLGELEARRREILERARELELKGTVLLAAEGVNLFVAGTRAAIDAFLEMIRSYDELADFQAKESWSDHQPFSRMLVRIKNEIIAFGVDGIAPEHKTSEKISAVQLKRWLDDGKDVALLDVRNDYEIELGTFENAIPIGLDNFRDFSPAVDQLSPELKRKPIVMFCTGGIRCEKAGPLMESKGFEEIYQLDGGILKYFEEVGGDHYDGECFVFDKRVALDAQLQETETTQCYACQHPLTADDQADRRYQPPRSCPYCYKTPEEKMAVEIEYRQSRLQQIANPLPGSIPYENSRPLNVPGRYDRWKLIEFLCDYHPHVSRDAWLEKIESGLLQADGEALTDPEMMVRGGRRIEHLFPMQTEPDVNTDIELIYVDDDIIVVNKPAPIPMHPCGRFNRNSLLNLLNLAFETDHLRIVHRLDAETTGVVVFARKGRIAKTLMQQFSGNTIRKEYVAKVVSHTTADRFESNQPISNAPGKSGAREIDPDGSPAHTLFETVCRNADDTSLVRCQPVTGRTNQIRIHLWGMGHPILGDDLYQLDGKPNAPETGLHLHAWKIGFNHPTSGKPIEFTAKLPAWAAQAEQQLI